MNKNKSMSDYLKELGELTKNNSLDTTTELIIIELIEKMHHATEVNLDLITGNSQIIGIMLDALENHRHCKGCNKMLIDNTECDCNA